MASVGLGWVGFSIKSFVILTHYYAWIRVKCFTHLLHINHTKFDNNLVVVACASRRWGGWAIERAGARTVFWVMCQIDTILGWHTHTHTQCETDEGAKLFSRHLICLVWWTRHEYKLIINIRDCGIDPCYLQTIDSQRVRLPHWCWRIAMDNIFFLCCCSCDGFRSIILICYGMWMIVVRVRLECGVHNVRFCFYFFCFWLTSYRFWICAHMID